MTLTSCCTRHETVQFGCPGNFKTPEDEITFLRQAIADMSENTSEVITQMTHENRDLQKEIARLKLLSTPESREAYKFMMAERDRLRTALDLARGVLGPAWESRLRT